MEKALIFILLLSCIKVSVHGQKCAIKKGYAYERSTLSGTPPRKVMDEGGNQVEVPMKNKSTYFIFMEIKKNRQIQPTRMWINGKAFNVTAEETKSPVVINYEQPRMTPDTLIGHTRNKLLKLQPTSEAATTNVTFPKKARSANVIIEYSRNSKIYYHAINDIKKLPPLVLQ